MKIDESTGDERWKLDPFDLATFPESASTLVSALSLDAHIKKTEIYELAITLFWP